MFFIMFGNFTKFQRVFDLPQVKRDLMYGMKTCLKVTSWVAEQLKT